MNEIQKCILSIYEVTKEILEKHGIRYYAIGGTAIGAVRHKGFIPWDDDMDIAVPVEEFKKLIGIAQHELPDGLELCFYGNYPKYAHVFMKVHDTATTFIEEFDFPCAANYKGVWLDIMPLGGIPKPDGEQKNYIRESRACWRTVREACYTFSEKNTLKSKLAWIAYQPRVRRLGKNSVEAWLDFLAEHPFGGSELTGYTWSPQLLPKLAFPTEWFSDYMEMPFEDTTIRVPVGYDQYLTQQFGDYMTIPPEDQQVTHGGFVDLDHSYRLYQTGELQIPPEYLEKGRNKR